MKDWIMPIGLCLVPLLLIVGMMYGIYKLSEPSQNAHRQKVSEINESERQECRNRGGLPINSQWAEGKMIDCVGI